MSPRRRAFAHSAFHVPISMIDVFALSLMAFMLLRQGAVESVRLPALKPADGAPSASTGRAPIDVAVSETGSIRVGDADCSLEDVADRIRADPDGARPIRLIVHLDDERRGAVETLVRLQLALGRADLMSRVFLATRPAATNAAP